MGLAEIKSLVQKRKSLIEDGLTGFGGRQQSSLSQEEVVTWLGYKAQWNLLNEILKEIIDSENKDYIEKRKAEENE